MKTTFRDIIDPSLKRDGRDAYKRYWLHILGSGAAVMLSAALRPVNIASAMKKLGHAERFERSRLNQSLKRLEGRGLVRRSVRDNGNEYLLLTEAGEHAYMAEKRRNLAIRRPKVWDKKWRIVIFDITEDKKNVRDAMRRHLGSLRFYPLQKSVFVTPYPCEEEIRFLQKFYEAETEICLIEATSLGAQEEPARKLFRI